MLAHHLHADHELVDYAPTVRRCRTSAQIISRPAAAQVTPGHPEHDSRHLRTLRGAAHLKGRGGMAKPATRRMTSMVDRGTLVGMARGVVKFYRAEKGWGALRRARRRV
jgi:hypothetical protein